ncbi:CD3e molecule, epsilon associated protein isoform X1 [Syngnathoides biaculeatus]|uniref:CD3e molecule, epsilon associated protein isoform X1 n=1 Tax=Syngnathoides biaculeatus TaxID=300417 RepID=UPI002ADD4835|nr:CD3e molecule, epsilon associated protein isoform X1 [Syngnathoides biaculeatus]
MPRDISPSSSDDEAAMSPAEATPKPKEVEKSRRYECPQDFESSGRRPCGGTLAETLRSGERELWLVKTPAGFDPRCLSGVKVNLCGLQTLTLPSAADAGGNRQVYNILASDHGAADLRLLTADSAVGPAFRGLLSVCESYGAAVAATASPGGLAQGFQPPGSKTQEAPEDGKTSSRRRKRKTSTSKLKWRTWR